MFTINDKKLQKKNSAENKLISRNNVNRVFLKSILRNLVVKMVKKFWKSYKLTLTKKNKIKSSLFLILWFILFTF